MKYLHRSANKICMDMSSACLYSVCSPTKQVTSRASSMTAPQGFHTYEWMRDGKALTSQKSIKVSRILVFIPLHSFPTSTRLHANIFKSCHLLSIVVILPQKPSLLQQHCTGIRRGKNCTFSTLRG